MADASIADISDQAYREWKHHPVSKVFFQYLQDYQIRLESEALARWKNKSLLEADEQEMRGRVLTLEELCDLPFISIQKFYEAEEVIEDGT